MIRLTLPWWALCTDNRRHTRGRNGQLVPTREYAAAKQAVSLLGLAACRGRHLITEPVEVVGVCYMPDDRKRDTGNYRKLILDALTGVAYEDDQLVYRETWERGPTDRTNPRMEVTIDYLSVASREGSGSCG